MTQEPTRRPDYWCDDPPAVPDPTYTPDPADVELVAGALCDADAHGVPWSVIGTRPAHTFRAAKYRAFARAGLAALAGRLLPADAETRTQWAVRGWGGGVYPMRDRDHAEDLASGDPERAVMTRTSWVGPWLPVPTDKP